MERFEDLPPTAPIREEDGLADVGDDEDVGLAAGAVPEALGAVVEKLGAATAFGDAPAD